jgi:general secretion pathway protein D
VRRFLTVLVIFWLAGCATNAFEQGKRLIEQGRVEEGLERLESVSNANPNNYEFRAHYVRARDQYVNRLLMEAEKARLSGRVTTAEIVYQRVLALHPGSAGAERGLEIVQAEQRHRAMIAEARALHEAGDTDAAREKVNTVLQENSSQREAQALRRRIEEQAARTTAGPSLRDTYKKPVTLEFRDAPLKSIFEVLSKASGINFVFDRDVRPDLRATIYLRETSIEDAVNFLLVTNQLEKKVLNDNTLLVYPNLPNKAREYQELMVKSFYLANADVKQTLNLIKTVVKTRDVFIDDRLNLLVMRDTPEAIQMAEKLIAAQDLAEPEVILEVEVLEVARNKLRDLGFRYPTEISAGVEGAAGPGRITLREWLDSRTDIVRLNITDPAFVINLRAQDGETKILANPRIRVKNREKAKIHIGDRLPVITTTSTANVGVSESVQYLDVGLRLDVEPNVYLEQEVAMKVSLEVSNIVQEIRSPSGTLTYRIGTRNTATVLRVANGETQALAGLIQDEDRRTVDKVPGLGDLPVIGRLFSASRDERNKTEIVLLITPYVVRNLDRPNPELLEFASGTEGSLGAPPLRLPGAGPQPAALSTPGVAQVQPLQIESVPGAEALPARTVAEAILLSAPLQVQAGREFAIALSAPPTMPGSVQLELLYDAAKLEAVARPDPSGRIALSVTGTTSVRFRALEGQSGPTQIAVGSVSATGANGEVIDIIAPAPVEININP